MSNFEKRSAWRPVLWTTLAVADLAHLIPALGGLCCVRGCCDPVRDVARLKSVSCVLLVGAIVLAAAPALAQDIPPPPSESHYTRRDRTGSDHRSVFESYADPVGYADSSGNASVYFYWPGGGGSWDESLREDVPGYVLESIAALRPVFEGIGPTPERPLWVGMVKEMHSTNAAGETTITGGRLRHCVRDAVPADVDPRGGAVHPFYRGARGGARDEQHLQQLLRLPAFPGMARRGRRRVSRQRGLSRRAKRRVLRGAVQEVWQGDPCRAMGRGAELRCLSLPQVAFE